MGPIRLCLDIPCPSPVTPNRLDPKTAMPGEGLVSVVAHPSCGRSFPVGLPSSCRDGVLICNIVMRLVRGVALDRVFHPNLLGRGGKIERVGFGLVSPLLVVVVLLASSPLRSPLGVDVEDVVKPVPHSPRCRPLFLPVRAADDSLALG